MNKSPVPSSYFNKETAHLPPSETAEKKARFISLRWRLLIPLFSVMLILLSAGTYGIAYALTEGYDDSETGELITRSETVQEAVTRFASQQQDESYRLAVTAGVRENIAARNGEALLRILEPLAELSRLDLVLVTDRNGIEVLGMQQNTREDQPDYAVTENTDLSQFGSVQRVIDTQSVSSEIIRAPRGLVLMTAVPVLAPTGEIIGVMITGTRLQDVLGTISDSSDVELTIFDTTGHLVLTTLPDTESVLNELALSSESVTQTLSVEDQIPVGSQVLDGRRYQVAYQPLNLHGSVVGVVAVYRESKAIFATGIARQVMGLLAATLAAGVVMIAYVFAARMIMRMERIRMTVEALSEGERIRTGMVATDEISQLAAAIDNYASRVEHRTDSLVASLRQRHRENGHLVAIIESLADGLVVMDNDGRVLMMNTAARRLVGGLRTIRTASLNQLTAAITDTLGPALAPGLYSLGDPTRITHEEKILQARAAAIISVSGKRLGTVITLRDVTDDVRIQQKQEELLEKLAQDVQTPMAHVAQDAALQAVTHRQRSTAPDSDTLLKFASDIARNARTMQRMIAELREVSTLSASEVQQSQKPISVSELIWNVAAQWKPIADAAELVLDLKIPNKVCYVAGNERRLRWALGNIVDNSIKYSLPGAGIKITGRITANDMVTIMIADDGVGIHSEDMKSIFQRFYRGKPHKPDGELIKTPGTGQGLYLSRHVIQVHGGDITVQSLPGVGTTVQVKLPLTASVTLEMPVSTDAEAENVSVEVENRGKVDGSLHTT